jgi:hypothetical protein
MAPAPAQARGRDAGGPLASAAAARVDKASSRAALGAYHAFLAEHLASIPAGQQQDDAFVASISAHCPNVLASVALLPEGSFNQAAITAFAQEAGADLALVANASTRPGLASMATALGRLRWSSRKTTAEIKRFLEGVQQLLTLAPSDLCLDAQALAASTAQVTPPGTLQLLATVHRLGSAAAAGTSGFIKILERFQTPAEGHMIAANNRLVGSIESASEKAVEAEGHKLLSVLGL